MSQEKECYCPCIVSGLCTCQKCIVGFHMPPIVEEKEGWEKRFDKFLTPEGFWNKENGMYPFNIKSFISQTLAEEREKEFWRGYQKGVDIQMDSRFLNEEEKLNIINNNK